MRLTATSAEIPAMPECNAEAIDRTDVERTTDRERTLGSDGSVVSHAVRVPKAEVFERCVVPKGGPRRLEPTALTRVRVRRPTLTWAQRVPTGGARNLASDRPACYSHTSIRGTAMVSITLREAAAEIVRPPRVASTKRAWKVASK